MTSKGCSSTMNHAGPGSDSVAKFTRACVAKGWGALVCPVSIGQTVEGRWLIAARVAPKQTTSPNTSAGLRGANNTSNAYPRPLVRPGDF